jgi:endonuclease/exonuclease/phosphatase family metal-dependent hydrolase
MYRKLGKVLVVTVVTCCVAVNCSLRYSNRMKKGEMVFAAKDYGDNLETTKNTLASKPQPQQQIRALQFNVWLDATKVSGGLELTARNILDSKADIVSLNEVKNFWGKDFVTSLQQELERQQPSTKWYGKFPGNPRKFSLDADTAIISKYPVLDERVVYRTLENSIVRSIIQVQPGRPPIAVYSVHLEYRAYSCYLPRGYSSNSQSYPGWNPLAPSLPRKEQEAHASKLRTGKQQSSTASPVTSSASSPLSSPPSSYWSTISWTIQSCLGVVKTVSLTGDEPSKQLYPVTDPNLVHRDNLSSGRPDAILRLIEDVESSLLKEPYYSTSCNSNINTISDSNIDSDSNNNCAFPILIMGDFNEPSSLDWNEDTQHTASHNGVVYSWETTRRLFQAGFIDSYREMYPNPLTHPGYTWPAAASPNNLSSISQMMNTGWIKNADERDRIDFIFYQNYQVPMIPNNDCAKDCCDSNSTKRRSFTIKPIDSWLVGTPVMVVGDKLVEESSAIGSFTAAVGIRPQEDDYHQETVTAKVSYHDKYSLKAGSAWPSDHRAVLTVFELSE